MKNRSSPKQKATPKRQSKQGRKPSTRRMKSKPATTPKSEPARRSRSKLKLRDPRWWVLLLLALLLGVMLANADKPGGSMRVVQKIAERLVTRL